MQFEVSVRKDMILIMIILSKVTAYILYHNRITRSSHFTQVNLKTKNRRRGLKEKNFVSLKWQTRLISIVSKPIIFFYFVVAFTLSSPKHWPSNRNFFSPYKNSETSQQKSRTCVFRPCLNRHQKELFYC